MLRLLPILFLSAPVFAAPLQLAHQGRLSDGNDAPLEGAHELVFALYDSETGGNTVWSETISAEFNGGHYSVVLGADVTANALDSAWFQDSNLYLSLAVDGGDPLEPRHALLSVPHAITTEVATHLEGGSVNADQVSIGGTPVIDASGEWVGPPIEASTSWTSLQDVPSGFSDGVDDDALGALSCLSGSIPEWDATGGQWVCGTDDNDTLTESEVEVFVTNGPINLAAGTVVDGQVLTTGTHTTSLAWSDITNRPTGLDDGDDEGTTLTESEVETYVTNGALNLDAGSTLGGSAISTGTHTSTLDFSALTNVPSGLADGDDVGTTLTESEVETYVVNGALDLDAGTTLGGASISTGAHAGGIPSGVIAPFAGTSAPSGWLLCDGSAVSKTTYADLFAVIGTTFGDANADFHLPDLNGRVPVGLGSTGTFATLGLTGGEENHTLSESEMPSHFHTWTASRQQAGTDDNNNSTEISHGDRGSGNTMTKDTNSKGSDQAHNNMPPYIVLNYIIKE